MSLIHIATRLRIASKEWLAFLNEKYEGGSKMVPNPNHKTVKRYPKVTLYTALRDEATRKRVDEEFTQWKSKSKVSEPTHNTFPQNVLISNEKIEVTHEKYQSHFTKLIDEVKNGDSYGAKGTKRLLTQSLSTYARNTDSLPYYKVMGELAKETLETMEEGNNQWLIPYAGFFGRLYESVEPTGSADIFMEQAFNWIDSSTCASSMSIHKYLSSLGVKGSYLKDDLENDTSVEITIHQKIQLRNAYTYQQAVFKHLGIKEVILYRGVDDTALSKEPPHKGEKINIKTRPASSWTSNPTVGVRFGCRVIKCTVPVEQILMSPLNYAEFGNEAGSEFEYVVMGAEGMECEIHTGAF